MNSRVILGIIMVALGLIIFLGNMDIIDGDYTLLIIGGGLFAGYFFSGERINKRKIGFLIAATIVSMIGIFDIVDNYVISDLSGSLFFLFIGTAFLLVYLLHTMHYNKNTGKRKWPLITSIALYTFSFFIYLVEVVNSEIFADIMNNYWPVILIIIGLVVLFKGIKKDNNK